MHILCPHCKNAIELVKLTPREEVLCPSCGSSFRLEADTTTSWTPRNDKLGKFELIEAVGQGAFGTVYRARDPELDRTVAVKVPRAGNLAGPQEFDRFLREARSVAQLHHPSIVSVHEVGQADGVPYLVSDFLPGVTLADLLSARRPGFRETAELIATVADALQYAHEHGVIHRDVKPSNIMIGDDGRPSVMDFGLAKRDAGEITMTVEGQVLGTPAYMSPEQAAGEAHRVDGRSDVYSLGVLAYQMLTGELPFRGTKRMLLHQVLRDEPKPPRRLNDQIPRDLETICLKAMAKEPARRYQTARALADDLRRYLKGEPIHARPVGRLERGGRWCRRNPVVAGLTAAVVLLLLGGTGFSLFFAFQAAGSAGEAREAQQLAEVKAEQARQGEWAAEVRLYDTRMNLIQNALERGETGRALEVLEIYRRAPAGSLDPRGWEWHYYDQRIGADSRPLQPVSRSGEDGPDAHPEGLPMGSLNREGNRFARLNADGTVTLWDVESGQVIRTFQVPPGFVAASAKFSPDLGSLAFVDDRGHVQGWDVPAGQCVAAWKPPAGGLDGSWSVKFFADATRLVAARVSGRVAGEQRVEIKVWNGITGQEAKTLNEPIGDGRCLAISPDGRRLAMASPPGKVGVWDLATGRLVQSLPGDPQSVTRLAFSPNSRRLAVATSHPEIVIKVYEVDGARGPRVLTGPPTSPQDEFFQESFEPPVFSPDGDRLMVLWNMGLGSTYHAAVWHVSTGRPLWVGRELKGWFADFALTADGTASITANLEGQVTRWDLMTGQEARVFPLSQGFRAMSLSPDGQTVALGGQGAVLLIDAATGQHRRTLQQHAQLVWSLAFSRDGTFLASGSADRTVKLCNVSTGQVVHTLTGHTAPVMSVAFSPDGLLLASATGSNARRGQPGEIKLWDPVVGREIRSLGKQSAGVTSVAFSPDGRLLASGSWDGTVTLWDVASGAERHRLRGITFGATCVAFSPDGCRLTASGNNDRIKVWDVASGREQATLRGLHLWSETVAFSPDGDRVFAASGNRHVKVWNVFTGQEVATLALPGPCLGIAFSPDGLRLMALGYKALQVWDVRPRTGDVKRERQARALLDGLIEQLVLKAEVLEQVRQCPWVTEAVRQQALDWGQGYREEAWRLNEASWAVVRRPGAGDSAYLLALRQAEAASRLAREDSSYLGTLGTAQYRVARYREAVEALTRADRTNSAQLNESHPANLAFLAMAQHRLGRPEQARATLARLRETMKKPNWAGDAELEAFLREAGELIDGRPARPGPVGDGRSGT
jgi:WD40 repeat protein/tRNA A-37 threonylcarbamoyl transferase component Bud32